VLADGDGQHCDISLDDLGPLGLALVHHAWKEVVAAVSSVRGLGEGISTPRSQALNARVWFPSAGRVLTRTTASNFSAVLSSTAHLNFYIGWWLKSFALLAFSYQLLFSLSSFSWDVFSTNVWVSAIPLFFCFLIALVALAFDHAYQSKFK